MKASPTLIVLCAALALGACGAKSPPSKAPVDTAAIIGAIKAGEVHWNSDYKSGDAGVLAAHYAPTATLMIPGSAPLVEGRIVADPQTIATAIRIGNPASWLGATDAVSQSNGLIESVTDAEILAAYARLAQLEGLFVEPASAAPVAGLLRMGQRGLIPKGSVVTLTLTGHGLKDPDTAMSQTMVDATVVEPSPETVLKTLGF